MDWSWMSLDRVKDHGAYEKGVEEFIKHAALNAGDRDRIVCPCLVCCHGKSVSVFELREHLLANGVDEYTHGIRHGGVHSGNLNLVNQSQDEGEGELEGQEQLEDNMRDCPEMFDSLSRDAKTPLYDGCSKYTKLSAVLKLYNIKAAGGISDKSFTLLLEAFNDMLPAKKVLPPRTYEAKKMLRSLGLSYEKIHACPNDCVLYRKEYASLKNCPKCHLSRYKKDQIPAKVLWYFPIIPRFRRLFGNAEDAKNLIWHSTRDWDGTLQHPADSPQWTLMDEQEPREEGPTFGSEPRNLRLGLATDGMNPHGNQSSTHSTWPVILTIYNLPPWLCMKRKYLMLSMLISGPKQPGNDIDVYLAPLIEDLKLLWDFGVEVYDAHKGENFNLKAMLFGTINDFPAYGNLSGYTVKGYKACPICEEKTSSIYLSCSRKNVYLKHRRFLRRNHPYRKKKNAFDGELEEERAPNPLSGEQVFDKVKDLNIKFGKGNEDLATTGYKKKSIFFQLPYWEKLYVRHFLDVMHIEKNICDSLIGTLLSIKGKNKDGVKARKDLVKLKIRVKLAPLMKGGRRMYLPPTCHTLSKKEKVSLCECLAGVKVPEGYSSNIKNLVSVKQLKLMGLKSHDCHVLMQQLLPVAIRNILPKHVRRAITKLCLFFKTICSKVIDPVNLNEVQNEIMVTCQLEMYFPPAFFDIMVHLASHLVREVQLCGPAYLRYMYPFERYMKVLKGYVMNRSRPEGCIVERYIVEEAMQFCSDHIPDGDVIGLPRPRSSRKTEGKSCHVIPISEDVWSQAHLNVLHNSDEVELFVEEHMKIIQGLNPHKSHKWVRDEHNKSFIDWLQERVFLLLQQKPASVPERLKWLALGPRKEVLSYKSYHINGCTFATKDQDDRTTMQNSSVTLMATAMHISSAKDKNPKYGKMTYYGVIDRIWELDYSMFRLPIFGCKWADNNNGVRVDDMGFTMVDLSRFGHKHDPFILADQAKQVFFVTDPADKKWSIVLSSSKRNAFEDPDEADIQAEPRELPYFVVEHDGDEISDEAYDVRPNHIEGTWIRTSNKIKAHSVSRKRKR